MKLQELQTFEQACEVLELDSKKVLPDFSCYPESDRKALESQAKLFIVVKAANKIENNSIEWTPDWNDRTDKYEAWFDLSSSGFRFNDYDNWNSNSNVSSHLCKRLLVPLQTLLT